MATYRTSRSIEASLIQYLEAELVSGGWSNISVEKSFNRVYDLAVGGASKKAVICVRLAETDIARGEIGSDSMIKNVMVLIDIFASSDGQRLDLKDFLVSKLIIGCVFYNYTTVQSGRSTSVNTKTADGRLRILNIDDTPVNFEVGKSELDVHDRYRHRLNLSISRGKLET